MTTPIQLKPMPSRARVATALLAALLAALAGCGGDASDSDPRPGVEPISCSDQPSPCA